jgi:hypothetical protein
MGMDEWDLYFNFGVMIFIADCKWAMMVASLSDIILILIKIYENW